MTKASLDSYETLSELNVGTRTFRYYSLVRFAEATGIDVNRLPFTLRVLLENLLRHEDGTAVSKDDAIALARWDGTARPEREIAFSPARVVLQDFTGVPAVVDLAALRDAVARLGGDATRINPIFPAELVIDHSVQVDSFGSPQSLTLNVEKEYQRNKERYALLRWGQTAFENFAVVPPSTGIVHQVNLEYLARVVFSADGVAYPDTCVGTDSHTTMINGLGVLGWGVGGIEAEAAMLGQPINLLIPQVIGFRLTGALPEGATATDLVLTITRVLRDHGVVGRFVEFFGAGLAHLPLADRATISNMCPEYGSTCAVFPVDAESLEYLRLTGRSDEQVALVEAYTQAQGLFTTSTSPESNYSEVIELDLGSVVPTIAGPRRPHDKVPLAEAKPSFVKTLPELVRGGASQPAPRAQVACDGSEFELTHGSVVIAAITSCTNTSNPYVMLGAGLLARKAVARGLTVKPWVKTSLAPGSTVVTEYLKESGVLADLEALRFHVVGYGCTTCIGNSGPLPEPIAKAIREQSLVAVSVLSGNRNFEGRVNPDTRANYLASPPLVVAYALAGRVDIDFSSEPIGHDAAGDGVYLRDIWPTPEEVRAAVEKSLHSAQFRREYADVFSGDVRWQALPVPAGSLFAWDPDSTYVRHPPFVEHTGLAPEPLAEIVGARALAVLGDTITTDHISPAGNIAKDSPAAKYLEEHGVSPAQFNQYGARRGNHEVMMRGTFANVRLRNHLVPGVEGGVTRHLPSGETMSIFDAAMRYRGDGVPLIVLAGREYGSGSSRDWAAKGTALLGVRAVIAESYERIHRSNLIGMGVLPLEFLPGQGRTALGLSGDEVFDVAGIADGLTPGKRLTVSVRSAAGERTFEVRARIDTLVELDYYRHGGILPFVLRQLVA